MACIFIFQVSNVQFILCLNLRCPNLMLYGCRVIECRLTPLECVKSHGNEEYQQVQSSVFWSLLHYSFHWLYHMIKVKKVTKHVARQWPLAFGCPPLELPKSVQYCSEQQGCIDAKHDCIRMSSNRTPQVLPCRKSYQLINVCKIWGTCALLLKLLVFWDVMPWWMMNRCWCFKEFFFFNPITGVERPWGFWDVEAPRFQDSRHMKVVRFSVLSTDLLYPSWNIPGTYFC